MELQDVACIPNIRRNLVFVSISDRLCYNFRFGFGKVILYHDSLLVGIGILSENLYRLDLFDNSFVYSSSSLNVAIGSKRTRMNEKYSMLWHKHLGHISRNRLERLKMAGIL